MQFNIRNFNITDLCYLYEICLKTGKSGNDATHLYKDPNILGHFYAAPYAIFEPELTFILTMDNLPIGYILGTKNSMEFEKISKTSWFPYLKEKYSYPQDDDISPEANITRKIFKGYEFETDLIDYPAHLHIDILTCGQGKGLGIKLMNTFIEKLKSLNIIGLHLQVGKSNRNAIQFYQKIGFALIKENEFSITFGMKII